MFRHATVLAVLGCLAFGSAVDLASAQVGEPIGTFHITVKQGGNIIADDDVSIGTGGELSDLKATFQDLTPESSTQIGVIGPAGSTSPIILKVTSDGGALENFRVLHWYIDVPVSTTDIYTPGPYSLLNPLGGNVEVAITGLKFDNGALATPQFSDNDTYLVSFMRDFRGNFYESVLANGYDVHHHGIYDIQVPGVRYLDGDATQYTFTGTAGTSCDWVWGNIINPGLTTNVYGNGTGETPLVPGYVFELGASIAFTAVPEPATLAAMLPGLLLLRRRR